MGLVDPESAPDLGSAPDEDQRPDGFSFEPSRYRAIRRAGQEAYRVLLDGLIANPEQRSLPRPPPATGRLPLRTVVRLAGNAVWGELERLHHEPRLPNGTPASQQLRSWYLAYEDDFRRYFPDQIVPELPESFELSDDDPSLTWERLLRVSAPLGEFLGRSKGPSPDAVTAFFVLLRDNVEALEGFLTALNFARLADLPEMAFEEVRHGGTAGGDLDIVFAKYQELYKEEPIPRGPVLAFAAFVYSGQTQLATSLQIQLPYRGLIDAIQQRDGAEQARPASVLDIQKRATPDLPAAKDELGVAPLVEGLSALLDDEGTSLPLAIGINAPWGAGKSSVMLQLRHALCGDEPGNRTWTPVQFDAWKFERSERLWAALGKAIYEQPQKAWPWWKWVRFKMRLELRRRSSRETALRVAVLALLLVASVATVLVGGLTLPALGGLTLFLAGAVDTVGRAWGLVGDPFKRVLDKHANRPKYEDQLGFTSEADLDIRLMTEELTKEDGHALLVLVDDLDRCSPRHIVEVVEAINQIFNSNANAECAFVIGMDRDMVAAGIEVAYADTVARLPMARQRNFGAAFLAKLVQISVSVPRPDEDAIERLLVSITKWDSASEASPQEDAVEDMQRRLATSRPANPADVQEAAEEIARDQALSADGREALDEAVRQERAKLFDCDSGDVQAAERLLVRHLDRNPREIKRFDNAFRLQLHVANGTKGCGLRFDIDDLVALGKSIVLRLRWPELGEAIDRDSSLLRRLEQASNGDKVRFEEGQAHWATDPDLLALLGGRSQQQPSRLAEHTILRVS